LRFKVGASYKLNAEPTTAEISQFDKMQSLFVKWSAVLVENSRIEMTIGNA
jgi:hypothetical protein